MPVMYLPSDMKFNTIYYYGFQNERDESKPKGDIEFQYVLLFSNHTQRGAHKVDKVVKSADSVQIKLNVGERIFKLRVRTAEADRWIEAIQLAANTAIELAKSKTGKSRNVSKLVEVYSKDSNGLEKLLEGKRQSFLPTSKVWEDSAELIEACKKTKEELIIVLFGVPIRFL